MNKFLNNQEAIILALLLLAFNVFMHSCNNDEIFLGQHDFMSLKQYTVGNDFHT